MNAVLDWATLFDHVRQPLFGGSLTAERVREMGAILDTCPAVLLTDPLVYCSFGHLACWHTNSPEPQDSSQR